VSASVGRKEVEFLNTDRLEQVAPLGFGGSIALFGGGALLLFVATRVVIPALASATTAEPIMLWFLAASTCVLCPLILTACWLLGREACWGKQRSWAIRLRLRTPTGRDWYWIIAGLVTIGFLTGGVVALLHLFFDKTALNPPFIAMQPLKAGRYWILAAWLPFFLLNILGEELLWRTVMLPRQETVFGTRAWLMNALGWTLFHAAFPWQVLLTLLPIAFVLPYVVHQRHNTWAGVIIHAGLGGAGFLALAFGVT
jgi:membrane protease YdiL (CAAX protease family)